MLPHTLISCLGSGRLSHLDFLSHMGQNDPQIMGTAWSSIAFHLFKISQLKKYQLYQVTGKLLNRFRKGHNPNLSCNWASILKDGGSKVPTNDYVVSIIWNAISSCTKALNLQYPESHHWWGWDPQNQPWGDDWNEKFHSIVLTLLAHASFILISQMI